FLGRRLTAGVVLVFAITTLAYLLLYLGSGDIARRILGQTATQEQVAAKTTELGLDRPLWDQYAGWLSGAFTGDLRSEEHTSELQSRLDRVCRLLLENTKVRRSIEVW